MKRLKKKVKKSTPPLTIKEKTKKELKLRKRIVKYFFKGLPIECKKSKISIETPDFGRTKIGLNGILLCLYDSEQEPTITFFNEEYFKNEPLCYLLSDYIENKAPSTEILYK